jgi:hypothetical protein
MCYDQLMGQLEQHKSKGSKTAAGEKKAVEDGDDEDGATIAEAGDGSHLVQNSQIVIRALQRAAMSSSSQEALSFEILSLEGAPSDTRSPQAQKSRVAASAGIASGRAAQMDTLIQKYVMSP